MKHLILFENYPQNPVDLKSLEEYLLRFGIPLEKWGKGYAKTLSHLLKEIESGECTILEEGGNLLREIEFAMCEMFYRDGKNLFKLIEKKQVFNDGRTRIRDKESSVSEKIMIGEDPLESLIRGVKEELGIILGESQIEEVGDVKKTESSQSFPGLITKYSGHNFTCFLNQDQYNPNGYVEVQKDKSTYFIWEEYTS
jgi:hypothetical protein